MWEHSPPAGVSRVVGLRLSLISCSKYNKYSIFMSFTRSAYCSAKFVVLNKPGAGGEIAFAAIATPPRCLLDGRGQRARLQVSADDAKDAVHHG